MGTYSTNSLPTSLSMQDVRSAIDNGGQYAKGCRFIVKIQAEGQSIINIMNGTKDFVYLCDAVEFPGRGFNVTEVRYNGPSQVFPSNVEYGAGLNLSFICRNRSAERAFFDDWMNIINPTSNWNYEYADNYYGTIMIYQLAEYASDSGWNYYKDSNHKPQNPLATYGWRLNKAWPTLVNPQQVTWNDQDILRLQVTFAYKYWDRPDYTP
jgi:hypothetical protein